MNSLNDIWQSILHQLEATLTPTAINTWFADCEPVDLGTRSIVLKTTGTFKRDILQKRFVPLIREKLTDLFATDEFDVIILTEEEVAEYLEKKKTDDVLPDQSLFDKPFRDTTWTNHWVPYQYRGILVAPDEKTRKAWQEEVRKY